MSQLNRQTRSLFIHVPKTAGSSMAALPFVGGCGHQTIKSFTRKGDVPKDFFRWGFVRHPGDRLVSIYHYVKLQTDGQKRWQHIQDIGSFERFILTLPEHRHKLVHTLPMTNFLCDTEGRCQLDFVGRFENLQNHFWSVVTRLGFPEAQLPRRKIGSHPHYETLFTPNMRRLVRALYRDDFRLWYPSEW